MTWRTLRTAAAAMMSLLIGASAASAQTTATTAMLRLRVDGPRVVDPAGKPVVLRGVNLGNWLLFEPGVYNGGIGTVKDQHTLFAVLRERFGEAERRRLIDLYRDHFITARDFDQVKAFDFNLVRIGFDYELFEDDERPMQLRADAFKYLDFAVREAKARGIYILFDLHGAQERQSNAKPSGREGHNKFFDDPKAQERSLWLWEQIARRYKGEPTVLGYEALNEPWGKSKAALRDYCARWYDRVRPIDGEAILCFPGWSNDIEFYGPPADSGWTNAMFDMHFYPGNFGWGNPDVETNARFLQHALPGWARRMERLNAPLLIGEINVVFKAAGGGEMMRRYYDFAAANHMPLTYWTLKELWPEGGLRDRMWMLTTNRDPLPKVDVRTSSAAEIEAAFKALATMPLIADPDLVHWLTSDAKPSPLAPVSTQPARRTTTRVATQPTGTQ